MRFRTTIPLRLPHPGAWALVVAATAACEGGTGPLPPPGEDPMGGDPTPRLVCRFTDDDDLLSVGAARGAIPALVNPPLVIPSHPDAGYIDDYLAAAGGDPGSPDARVVGISLGDTAIAVPHNIMWWHEVVNIDLGGRRLAVTYCPLTGSALAFDLTALGARRLGVSGLIYQNNLVMFDEETESLWPQLCLGAVHGARDGTALTPVQVTDMRWEAWRDLHPNTLVVSRETGFDFAYDRYPYAFYETNDLLLFAHPGPLDPRRPAKERVFGLTPEGGLAFPFGELGGVDRWAAIGQRVAGEEVIVLWDGDAQAAAAFRPQLADGTPLSLGASRDGIRDFETGSRWTVEGLAVEGTLAGQRLTWYEEAYVAYWFAWTAFNPETRVWVFE